MPIVAMVAIDLLDMAVLRLTLAPFQHHAPVRQEHGRTIPLAEVMRPRGQGSMLEADSHLALMGPVITYKTHGRVYCPLIHLVP